MTFLWEKMEMYIESERLIITDLTMSMSGDFQKNSLDEDNRRFVPDEVFDTIEKAEETVGWLINSYQSPNGPFVYPVIKKDNVNIGYVQACCIEEGYEIGYHIAKNYTRKGFATEAVEAFLPVIMAELKIDRIYGIVLEENYASHKVLEKCGFELVYRGLGMYQRNNRELRKYIFQI